MTATGVEFKFGYQLDSITEDGAVFMDERWRKVMVKADAVILSLGFTPNKDAADEFRGIAPDTYVIGDCRRVANVMQAVHDGFNAASLL